MSDVLVCSNKYRKICYNMAGVCEDNQNVMSQNELKMLIPFSGYPPVMPAFV